MMVRATARKTSRTGFFAGNLFGGGGEKAWLATHPLSSLLFTFFNPSVLTRRRADALAGEGGVQTNAYTRGPEITLNLHLVLIIARRRHISVGTLVICHRQALSSLAGSDISL